MEKQENINELSKPLGTIRISELQTLLIKQAVREVFPELQGLIKQAVQEAMQKTPEQEEFERQEQKDEKNYQRQKDLYLIIFACVLITVIFLYAIFLLQKPNHSGDEEKFSLAVLTVIAIGAVGFVTGKAIVVRQ